MELSTTGVAAQGTGSRFAPGSTIAGRYTVERWLGKGGMGEVYQVVDEQLGEAVALKTLTERLAGDATALARFQAEVKSARRVTHPNVCRTFDVGVHTDERGTIQFLTMELLAGETLDARLERGPITRDELLPIIAQVALAIDAAHAAGVVHRDLKPSNIVLVAAASAGAAPRAVVTDFGLARRIDEARVTGDGWVGTPAYVAPEQLEGQAGGPAVDLYALGVILFRAATGRLPFLGESAALMALQRVVRDAPSARQLDPTIPAEWDRAIARCLERKPEDRPASGHDVIAALGGQTIMPRPRAVRRRAWRGVVAVIGVAVVVAIAVGILRLRRRAASRSAALPAADRLISVEVVRAERSPPLNLPVDAPPFEDAAAWVFADQWRRLEQRRRFRLVTRAPGNAVARVIWETTADGVAARLEVGTAARLTVAGPEVRASSIQDAAIELYPQLAARAGDGQADVELFPDEREEMRALAAPDPRAYDDLVAAFDDYWRIAPLPHEPYYERLDALLARYPDWAQVAALRIRETGADTEVAHRILATHLDVARASGRDPLGVKLLESIGGIASGQIPPALREELMHSRVAVVLLWSEFSDYTELTRRFPHLQFGGDLYWSLVNRGLDAAAEEALRDWLRRAPGQEYAWKTLAARVRDRGDSVAEAQVEDAFRRLFGRPSAERFELALVKLSHLQLTEAAAMAGPSLLEPVPVGVHAIELLAEVEVLSGHFVRAADLMLRAWEKARDSGPGNWDLHYVQYARELLRMAELRGLSQEADRWRSEMLAKMAGLPFATWGPRYQAPFRYEAERARTHRCPDQEPFVAGIVDEIERREARALVLRAAARAACARCSAVVVAGELRDEGMLPWTIELARCAVEERAHLDQAERALASTDRFTLGASPGVDFALSTYWLGRVLEAKGDAAGAKARYERFLSFWGAADLPVPEVADTRRRLAALPRATP